MSDWPPELTGNEGFLTAEDAALKAKLLGALTVDVQGTERPVGVWYRWPQGETTARTYPFITLDLIDLNYDATRAHSGIVEVDYIPSVRPARPYDTAPNSVHVVEYPMPYLLTYQVSLFTRSALHDRRLLAALIAHGLMPYRNAFLWIPEDGTRRRLFTRDISTSTFTDEKNLTSHRRTLTIDVEAELLHQEVVDTRLVTEVNFQHVLSLANPAMVPVI